jgi:hypothetical protein
MSTSLSIATNIPQTVINVAKKLPNYLKEGFIDLNAPKAITNHNVWIAPSEIAANPSFQALLQERERTVLEKDAKILGLSAASIGAGLLAVSGNFVDMFTHPVQSLVAAVVPAVMGARALNKLGQLENLKASHFVANSMVRNAQEMELAEKLMAHQQQLARMGGLQEGPVQQTAELIREQAEDLPFKTSNPQPNSKND